jgi:hypothetical protein
MVEEIKRQLAERDGPDAGRLLRERRQLRRAQRVRQLRQDELRHAGYSATGYFITVKHGVIALDEGAEGKDARRIVSIKVRYKDRDLSAQVVDSGDANVEVHSGDWAIIKVAGKVDLPALRVDTSYGYDFAEPIFRLGNDYSKGIILSTGYVGQRTSNGLVTCLTDGHPACPAAASSTSRATRRHPDRPDAGRLPVLVHPARPRRDVPQGCPGCRSRN